MLTRPGNSADQRRAFGAPGPSVVSVWLDHLRPLQGGFEHTTLACYLACTGCQEQPQQGVMHHEWCSCAWGGGFKVLVRMGAQNCAALYTADSGIALGLGSSQSPPVKYNRGCMWRVALHSARLNFCFRPGDTVDSLQYLLLYYATYYHRSFVCVRIVSWADTSSDKCLFLAGTHDSASKHPARSRAFTQSTCGRNGLRLRLSSDHHLNCLLL